MGVISGLVLGGYQLVGLVLDQVGLLGLSSEVVRFLWGFSAIVLLVCAVWMLLCVVLDCCCVLTGCWSVLFGSFVFCVCREKK